MSEQYDFDMTGFEAVKKEFAEATSNRGELVTRFDGIEEIYFMDGKGSGVSGETISPSGRNKVDQATMLLTAGRPEFSVPRDKNTPDADKLSSTLEKAATKMWNASNAEQRMVVERELAFSAFMYDEMSARVLSTKDMLDALTEARDAAKEQDGYDERRWDADIEHAKRRMERTPYLIEPLYPKTAIPIYSRNELLAMGTSTEMRVADVKKDYGARVINQVAGQKDWATVTVNEWFDKTYRYTWLDKQDTPIYAEAHGLNFLPAASVRVKGKRFFTEVKRQNEPFLFSLLTSGMWPAENKMLTAWVKNVTGMINAGFYYKKANAEDTLETIPHNVIGAVVHGQGSLQPLSKDLINRDSLELWQLMNSIVGESTMQAQDAGIGGSAPFSMVALLSQIRRLPIIPVQQAEQVLLADLLEIMFRWMQHEKRDYDELKYAEIPNVIDVDVMLEPDLPQDKVQMATVVDSLTRGDDPMFDKEWGRAFMGEGQSEEIQKKIWTEKSAQAAFQQTAQQLLKMLAEGGLSNQERADVAGELTMRQKNFIEHGQDPNRPTPQQGMPVEAQVMPNEMQGGGG